MYVIKKPDLLLLTQDVLQLTSEIQQFQWIYINVKLKFHRKLITCKEDSGILCTVYLLNHILTKLPLKHCIHKSLKSGSTMK